MLQEDLSYTGWEILTPDNEGTLVFPCCLIHYHRSGSLHKSEGSCTGLVGSLPQASESGGRWEDLGMNLFPVHPVVAESSS